jgi:transcriptional regulator with XRE-family HTH domain
VCCGVIGSCMGTTIVPFSRLDYPQRNDYCSLMALSKQRTPLAKVRMMIGAALGQEKRFADLCGISTSAVKKLSAGIRPMSRDFAEKISGATGASPDWLQTGAGCEALNATKFSRVSFDAWKRGVEGGGNIDAATYEERLRSQRQDFGIIMADLASVARSAARRGMLDALLYRLETFAREQGEEFGRGTRDIDVALRLAWALQDEDRATATPPSQTPPRSRGRKAKP